MRKAALYLIILLGVSSAQAVEPLSTIEISIASVDSVLQNAPYEPEFRYCRDALSILTIAWNDAAYAGARGDLNRATARLMEGLRDASDSFDVSRRNASGPLTQRAIERMHAIAIVVSRTLIGESNSLRSRHYFLQQAYPFIFKIAQDIDLPYYIPVHYCNRCADSRPSDWEVEKAFINFADAQLDFIRDALTTNSPTYVFPVGSGKAYLSALRMTMGYLVIDLQESAFESLYSCVRDEARRIGQWLGHELDLPAEHRDTFNDVQIAYGRAACLGESLNDLRAYIPQESCRRVEAPSCGYKE